MNAKFLVAIMLTFVMLTSISTMVLAENETDVDDELPEPGIGPGNAFYGIENSWDKMRLAFTFNKEKKIQKAIEMAEERLAEAEASNDSELAEEARLRYEEFIAKAEEALENIEAKKAEGLVVAIAQTVRAQERIEAHMEKVSGVHNRILERLRAEGNMTEEQIAHLEEVFGRIQDRAERAQNRVEQRQENLRARYKVLTNATDEEINESIETYRAEYQERLQEKLQKRLNRSDEDEEDEDEEDEDEEDENDSEQGNQTQAGQ
jgi:hypothetical protein